MKPFDPRLLRHARAARGVLLAGAGFGLLRTAAILAWCWCLAHAIAALVLPVLEGEGGGAGRIAEGAPSVEMVPWLLLGGLLAVVVRSAASWSMDAVAARGAVRVKAQLREAALDALDRRSPLRDARLGGAADAGAADPGAADSEAAGVSGDAALATVLGRGLDALDGYFSGYLPQLILTAVATPPLILAILLADPLSGVIVCIVFPVIPVFMILIGLATQAVQDRQWAQLQRLSASFLDAVSGLATLKIFRREHRQAARIARETGEYRSRTMRVLRVTFLSGFVLDLAGTFSIALVAVTVGTRLVTGEFPLALGLFVLLLLPEAFVPVRQVGAAFHASAEGLAAASRVFAIIEGDDESDRSGGDSRGRARRGGARRGGTGRGAARDASFDAAREAARGSDPGAGIRATGLRIDRGGRRVVGPVDLVVAPGELVALAGPSGAGKSSILAALLGFVEPSGGELERPGELAWVGQRPGLLQGTVAENVALGPGEPDPALVRASLAAAGIPEISPETVLGALGAGLSGGQAQRVAIARALYRAAQRPGAALLLDEPSSALDPGHEAVLAATLRREADRGRAVLVVSHRRGLLEAADRVVRIAAVDAERSASGAER
ncbi:thiol reductant ABC exporter subunit CydD [Leucobacter allii]|uniref:thiol reductant ABC exporter subunit CydD n=1 Tax=Leucobacter allii TaxID=2932247 RepID=UPI001FD4D49C|nr:thiol reductant ABC exporter subunit CydD [Leucobacter allii]UOR03258.1 thiol reductant ABC exporter subunit CydD [Leucobacter allii]